MANASIRILTPRLEHHAGLIELLPRLAAFDVPPRRRREDLWQGDAQLLDQWFKGEQPLLHVRCALDGQARIAGVALFSLRKELLSGAPSAHLEALAVSDRHEGQGVASALLDDCHERAHELGALTMTLHVFNTNRRARDLYLHKGYEPELQRCIKWLQDDDIEHN